MILHVVEERMIKKRVYMFVRGGGGGVGGGGCGRLKELLPLV